ncbi:putative CALMODULIN-BINDING PROTEIN60 [Helianthus annuus]|nr:putative CALMODULIN-BINDING PROTEIN60 [Helianthus annuus]KAJ0748211.1 putative CALMODULIN-BINDING PROTEIN60 [Helianthus annuus]
MCSTYHQNLGYQYEASASSKLPVNLKLVFSKEVASPVFTKQKITGKAIGDDGNTSIQVILVDRNTHQRITSGAEASAKVKMVLLRGDCGGSTSRGFEENIVVDWKKKKNILQGDMYVYLQRGCGTVGEIRIKHDKNSLKNVKFRLGAMIVDTSYEVEEAITNPFEVKDHRNLPKCLRPLSLEDRVGKMMNISNKGTGKIRTRLESKNIRTVRDFLGMHSLNPQELQEICGIKGKRWEMTVKHAKTSLTGNMVCVSISNPYNFKKSLDI